MIGVAGPFSQPRGVSMQRAAQLAADEINARRGVGGGGGGRAGRQIRLQFADDSGREDVALRIAHAFVANPAVVAVIGHLSSGTSIAAGRLYGQGDDPVVMISPSASSPDLSGLNPYVFRVCPSDLTHGPQLARFARQTLGASRAGVIYINNDYGRGVRATFVSEFTRIGGTVLEEDPYVPATTSLEPYLARMRQSGGVDVLMLATERGGAELALREMANLGTRWPVIGGDALTGVEAAGGGLAEGVRVSSAYLPDRSGDRNAAFVAKYGEVYAGERPDHRGAGAYDIVYLLARAAHDVGTGRRALRNYLAGVGRSTPAFEGVTGTIAFDDRGDVPAKPVVIGIVRGGRLVTEGAR
ncbi:MAG: ABC transporter substrate-binding protein [Gemmatimonadales bacterium]